VLERMIETAAALRKSVHVSPLRPAVLPRPSLPLPNLEGAASAIQSQTTEHPDVLGSVALSSAIEVGSVSPAPNDPRGGGNLANASRFDEGNAASKLVTATTPAVTPPIEYRMAESPPSLKPPRAGDDLDLEALTDEWAARVRSKAACLRAHREGVLDSTGGGVGFFLYHARKAAGTTLRGYLEGLCAGTYSPRPRALRGSGDGGCLFETEGLSLNPEFLRLANTGGRVVTATTLREPVARALSLYWSGGFEYFWLVG
jgi:hypothetical protein